MNKIIDGVDVSECNAYKDKHCLDKTSIICEKYHQALQEIRDIAGSIIGNANATYTGFYNKLSDILDKINEVIGAE